MALWRCGAVALWRCGAVTLWRCGAVALWRCGAVALWRCGAVALWRCGAVALWRCMFSIRPSIERELVLLRFLSFRTLSKFAQSSLLLQVFIRMLEYLAIDAGMCLCAKSFHALIAPCKSALWIVP